MNNENEVDPIDLSSNYSGAFRHASLTNDELLRLTNQDRCMIHGPALFALKYRVLPCSLIQNLQGTMGGYRDIYAYNLTGQFSTHGRGRQFCARRKYGGMYHATRLVI